ncbi:MAG: N-acetyltransferase [Faecalibacterium sp.]|jgi:predicted N-acetyltransferase YhbS|nr:N-acetyltransferase [Faecalibacterium sp.]
MLIRNETKEDYRAVEELTRKAFWNVHVPGCEEHFLVHQMRNHPDFVPELDFVLEEEHQIVANILYTKAKLIDEDKNEKSILTFGPLSVLPEYQRRGYGKRLLEYSFQKARELGFDCIVIFGNPENYAARGFQSCKKYQVSLGEGIFPTALLVKELKAGTLAGQNWTYCESPAYEIDPSGFEAYDKTFAPLEKAYRPSQELFYIYSHSRITE